MLQFLTEFIRIPIQIFNWAWNNLTFQFYIGAGNVITVRFLEVVIAFMIIAMFTSIFWRSAKW